MLPLKGTHQTPQRTIVIQKKSRKAVLRTTDNWLSESTPTPIPTPTFARRLCDVEWDISEQSECPSPLSGSITVPGILFEKKYRDKFVNYQQYALRSLKFFFNIKTNLWVFELTNVQYSTKILIKKEFEYLALLKKLQLLQWMEKVKFNFKCPSNVK